MKYILIILLFCLVFISCKKEPENHIDPPPPDDTTTYVIPRTNWLDVADLNYSSQAMRLEMIGAMNYWITVADIDGFRCDAADMVPFDFWQQAITALDTANEKEASR